MKVCFLVSSMFLAQFIFRYLRYPRNRAFLGEGIAIRKPHTTYEFERSLLHVILCQVTGKRSPWKNYFGPWKVLQNFLIFPPKILYAPWLSYHSFLGRNLCFKNAFGQLISTRLNSFLAFLLFIVEHSGDKQKRKTKELTKGTWHSTCTFLYPLTEPLLSVSTVYKA